MIVQSNTVSHILETLLSNKMWPLKGAINLSFHSHFIHQISRKPHLILNFISRPGPWNPSNWTTHTLIERIFNSNNPYCSHLSPFWSPCKAQSLTFNGGWYSNYHQKGRTGIHLLSPDSNRFYIVRFFSLCSIQSQDATEIIVVSRHQLMILSIFAPIQMLNHQTGWHELHPYKWGSKDCLQIVPFVVFANSFVP